MNAIENGWLPIGTPNDIEILKEMLIWEKKYGKPDSIKPMEHKLKQQQAIL